MKRVFLAGAAVLFITITAFAQTSGKIEIRLKNNDAREQQTKVQLERLLASYDLSKWMFTRTVLIESGRNVIPHSHYTWIYKTVMERSRDIAQILFKYKLTPP